MSKPKNTKQVDEAIQRATAAFEEWLEDFYIRNRKSWVEGPPYAWAAVGFPYQSYAIAADFALSTASPENIMQRLIGAFESSVSNAMNHVPQGAMMVWRERPHILGRGTCIEMHARLAVVPIGVALLELPPTPPPTPPRAKKAAKNTAPPPAPDKKKGKEK